MTDIKTILGFQNQYLFELLVNQLEGAIVTDHEGRCAYVSQKYSELTEFLVKDIQGLYIRDVFHCTHIDEVLVTRKPLYNRPLTINTAAGETLQTRCTYIPLVQNRQLIGCFIYLFIENITKDLQTTGQIHYLIQALHQTKPVNPIRQQKRDLEKISITTALQKTDGNKTQAAKLLGISRTMLHKKIKNYQLDL